MKGTSHIFAWIWMMLVLNTMFQSCFQTLHIEGDDPVNSLSELVLESVFDFEDGLQTDEQDESTRKLKTANTLHWHCEMAGVVLPQLFSFRQTQNRLGEMGICLNFSGEVLLPPPDGRLLI